MGAVQITEEQYVLEDTNSIKKVLRAFPLKIRQLEEQISAENIVKEQLIANKKTIESDVVLEIYREKIEVEVEKKVDKRSMSKEEKENFKPIFETIFKKKYHNDVQREAEARHRLANHKEFNQFQGRIDKLSQDINAKMIQLSYMKRLNSNAGYLAILGVN